MSRTIPLAQMLTMVTHAACRSVLPLVKCVDETIADEEGAALVAAGLGSRSVPHCVALFFDSRP